MIAIEIQWHLKWKIYSSLFIFDAGDGDDKNMEPMELEQITMGNTSLWLAEHGESYCRSSELNTAYHCWGL
jgi:hypothetical protein